jgi:hypothetical protein
MRGIAAVLLLTALPACAADRDARFFDERVAPILEKRCLACHNKRANALPLAFTYRRFAHRDSSVIGRNPSGSRRRRGLCDVFTKPPAVKQFYGRRLVQFTA